MITSLPTVDSPDLVRMLRSDPGSGVPAVLERHGDALYDYALGLLADHAGAGGTVHDVLIQAVAAAGRLRDPQELERWLYALVRNEGMRRRAAGTGTASRMRPVNELDPAVMAFDVKAPGVLDLVLRHGFGPADVATVLGIRAGRAQELVAQVRGLAENGRPSSPHATMPARLPEEIAASLGNPGLVAVVVEHAGPLARSGFPASADPRPQRLVALAAVAVAVLVCAGVVVIGGPDRSDAPEKAGLRPPPQEPPTTSSEPSPPVPYTPSPSPSPTASPTASPPAPRRPTPTPSKDPTPTQDARPPLDVGLSVVRRGRGCPTTWRAFAFGRVGGGAAQKVTVAWSAPGEPTRTVGTTLTSSGGYRTTVSGLPFGRRVSITAVAVGPDGRRGISRTVTRTVPTCANRGDD